MKVIIASWHIYYVITCNLTVICPGIWELYMAIIALLCYISNDLWEFLLSELKKSKAIIDAFYLIVIMIYFEESFLFGVFIAFLYTNAVSSDMATKTYWIIFIMQLMWQQFRCYFFCYEVSIFYGKSLSISNLT
jgi:hypothetical protein